LKLECYFCIQITLRKMMVPPFDGTLKRSSGQEREEEGIEIERK
jgi:hypothetical protein